MTSSASSPSSPPPPSASACFNSLYLAPRSAAALLALESSLKSSQASFEVQPRVFYEDFKNYVLYVQDVRPAAGAALWHHVFLADLSQPGDPRVTTADQAVVVNGSSATGDAQTIRLHLINGSQHQTSPSDPAQYNISTFTSTDLPIETGAQEDTHVGRSDTPILALSATASSCRRGNSAPETAHASNIYRIEFNKRFSYPFACLVLMLVGVPLGLSSQRGGKSHRLRPHHPARLHLLLPLLDRRRFRQNRQALTLPRRLGCQPHLRRRRRLLLYQLSRGGIALSVFASLADWLKRTSTNLLPGQDPDPEQKSRFTVATVLRRIRSVFGSRFPLLLDDYVLREFSTNLALVLATFATLFLVFTFFELIGDIIRNRTPLVTVGDYLLNLIPYILYNTTPLCALVAVLITFGALNRTSELTAMKATGISLYRVVIPVLVLCAAIAAGLFAFDEFYLPAANRRQESLRATIKGKPAQTFLRPDRKWISGQTGNQTESSANADSRAGNHISHNADPGRIFYYQFFDADKNVFANLTVFEFAPGTFTLQRRIFAASAHWDTHANQWIFENGWQRTFAGETTSSYQPFSVSTFPEIREQPTYFKKEDRPSQEMNYGELSRYITDLSQSGFDTMRLRVQLNRKLAYPLITLVMAILAIPSRSRWASAEDSPASPPPSAWPLRTGS